MPAPVTICDQNPEKVISGFGDPWQKILLIYFLNLYPKGNNVPVLRLFGSNNILANPGDPN